jgi:hypothetical protein
VTSRPLIVLAAARARRGGHTYTLWPDARRPMIAADMGYPPAAEWLRRTMVPTLRRLPDAAMWMSLRARAALIAEADGLAARLGTNVMRGDPPRVAMYSPSGQVVSKAVCFLFRDGEQDPRIVVKAVADPRFDWRLRNESTLLESIRDRIRHDARLAVTLPATPLFAGEAEGEFVLVETFDALAVATGSVTQTRASDWLHAFQAASRSHAKPWDAEDERSALERVHDAWRLSGSGSENKVVARARELLAAVSGASVPRCAVHGDFWRGNVAARDDSLRVYDWEWAKLDGTPFFDLWTYELAELRLLARRREPALEERLAAAHERVRDELRRRDIDDRFALAMLPAVLGEVSFRIRTRLQVPDEMEPHSISVIAAAERLLAR